MNNEIDDIKKLQAIYKYMKAKNIDKITIDRTKDEDKNINVYTIDAIIGTKHKKVTVNKKERKTFTIKKTKSKEKDKEKDKYFENQKRKTEDLVNCIQEFKQKIKELNSLLKKNDKNKYNFLSGILKVISPSLSTLEKYIK